MTQSTFTPWAPSHVVCDDSSLVSSNELAQKAMIVEDSDKINYLLAFVLTVAVVDMIIDDMMKP
jgi:hypothetical protein